MWKYRDTIKNFNLGKPTFVKTKDEKNLTVNPSKAETISRLARKSNPYGKLELDEISHRSYSSPIIQEFCEKWEPGYEMIEDLDNDVTEALEGLKTEFPSFTKLIKDSNKRILWHQKKADLNDREKESPDNDIKVELNEDNGEHFESLLDDKSESPSFC